MNTSMALIHSAEDSSYKLVAAIKKHPNDPNTYQLKLIQHRTDGRPTWNPREILDINISVDGLSLLRDLINSELPEERK